MKILIADDEKNLRKLLTNEISELGHEVDEAQSGVQVLEKLEGNGYDVLVLDLNMPRLSGMEVLKRLKTQENPVEVIILTGHATVSTAVESIKLGAYDYLTKPFKIEELQVAIEKAYERKKLLRENLLLKTQIKKQAQTHRIITQSPRLCEILEQVKKIALSNFPALISGESGVGKELIAQAIHDSSARESGPFIPINCGAIQENMLESELFGHEKGAFTGAYAKKLGLLEIANGGTLFLDEVGELTPALQSKLLRVIETGSFFRVGGIKEVKVDVRFVAATNKEIKKEVEAGNFRSDLYYRISALTIHIPPLRERREDIPLLVDYFLKNTPSFRNKTFSEEALGVLTEYSWPGNVRELQNIVHRALLLSLGDVIGPGDIPADLRKGGNGESYGKRLEDVEREHILKVFNAVGRQKGKAADILGMDPKTLYRKLLSYGVNEREAFSKWK